MNVNSKRPFASVFTGLVPDVTCTTFLSESYRVTCTPWSGVFSSWSDRLAMNPYAVTSDVTGSTGSSPEGGAHADCDTSGIDSITASARTSASFPPEVLMRLESRPRLIMPSSGRAARVEEPSRTLSRNP